MDVKFVVTDLETSRLSIHPLPKHYVYFGNICGFYVFYIIKHYVCLLSYLTYSPYHIHTLCARNFVSFVS